MITTALLDTFLAPLLAALAVLPKGNLFAFPTLTQDGTTIGAYMSFLNTFFPITDVLTMMKLVYEVVLPFIFTYKIMEWTYCHIPEILGFGPGPG